MEDALRAASNLLEEATVQELQEMMASGKLTARDLVKGYMLRIASFDSSGPRINSVLEVNPEALFIAQALDIEREQKGARGPLHGIPILIKDNIDTKDMMHTSAGSLALENSYAPDDAFIVKKLRKAGAVILGKANMTEWANFMSDHMPNGYSSRGGQVRNPYGPGIHDVGGSSSGSGAAVAANLCSIAIGTETSGSILNPACNNSVVGIKPTVGLVSRTGVIPISHVQDTPGPLARTVEDAAILLSAIAGVDEQDEATWSSLEKNCGDYTKFLDKDGLRGIRIGIPTSFLEKLNEEQRDIFARALEALRDAGACVVDVDMATPQPWQSRSLVYEFKPCINRYLSRLSRDVPVHSLKELIEFNKSRPAKMLRYGQSVLIQSEQTSGTLKEPEYIQGRFKEEEESRTKGIDFVLKENKVEALLFPGLMNAAISARAGYPSISLPAGYTEAGRPFGVTFTAGAYSEPLLIRFAYAFEQVTKIRKPPDLGGFEN